VQSACEDQVLSASDGRNVPRISHAWSPGANLTTCAVPPALQGLCRIQEAMTWYLALPSVGFVEFIEFGEFVEFIEAGDS
jgi:hypothetical protein